MPKKQLKRPKPPEHRAVFGSIMMPSLPNSRNGLVWKLMLPTTFLWLWPMSSAWMVRC